LTTTQATTYERLLSPIEVGPITVRNRSVFTAHTTNMSQDDNLVGDQLFHYHVERARGGAGLIVLEANAVHPAAEIHGTSLRAWDPRIVEGYERLSEAVHAEGAKMVVQLFHSGAHANFLKTLHVLWSPSGVPSSVDRESPHVMDGGDIEELIESYAQSSATITSAGMDGVEVHLGHSYLPAQFLSPLYNRRTDEWGGSLENRMRLSLAILERVREHVAGGKVVGIRISGEELVGKGLTRDEMAVVCATIAERGLADYISVSVGSHHTRHMMVPPMVIGSGYLLDLSRHIRDAAGGQLRLARLLPGRAEIFLIVEHLTRELDRLQVPINFGREITEVDEHAYDVVVVATGSTPSRSAYSGIDPRIAAIGGVDDPKVVSLDDILLGVEVGLRVAVVAEEPGYKILGAAEVLVGRGCDVTVVGSADVPGADMLVTGDYQIVQPRLVAAGVDFVGGHGVTDVTGGRVRALNGVGEEVDVGEFDTVVLLYGRDADDALYRALAAHDVRRELIGDALAARRLDPAIFEGDRIGRAI
jgi:2,4-dienoyl-CoA reductase-like NADH-dependent reductase (Old Yellow Enzyme family)